MKQTTVTGFLTTFQWLKVIGESATVAAGKVVATLAHPKAEQQPAPLPRATQAAPAQPAGAWRVAPTHKAITAYYAQLAELRGQGVTNEQGLRPAFQTLLATIAAEGKVGWTLIPEARHGRGNIPDATLQDRNTLPRGFWEAKDTKDNLDTEVARKLARGYPTDNTIFEDTRRGLLFQGGNTPVLDIDLTDRGALADLLTAFFAHEQPAYVEFGRAVVEFKGRVPELARGLLKKIGDERRERNTDFTAAYAKFQAVCQESIAPDITEEEIDEMLAQHLLTERLFRTVFDNDAFTSRNVIAGEIEKVIDALTSRAFNRREFLQQLDRFYLAIEAAAKTISNYASKQTFLNTVYESFFQGFARDQADTHGIVYTPQPIVEFMCASVDHVLKTEFGRDLSHPDVKVLDPCTGTGNFIVRLMERIDPLALPGKYANDLFANEIMLLPYYIASMNIEHAYYAKMEGYRAFEGLCFVDTLKMETAQASMFAERNTERIARQNQSDLMVIIGNPPYNVGQENENDNNKNRRYPKIESRIRETYAHDSQATNKNALSDAYVKFFRWASDRLRDRDGIVCFVTNDSFVNQIAFDGMRKQLLQDFTQIWHLDLHGNVRQNPKLSGTTHNVFGIQVGVGITIAIRNRANPAKGLWYYRVPEMWRKEEKLAFLQEHESVANIPWQELEPDENTSQWLTEGMRPEFATFLPIGSKIDKRAKGEVKTIFKTYSRGAETTRDSWMYDFDRERLAAKAASMIETYDAEVSRWVRAGCPKDIDSFVLNDETKIKWSSRLKECLARKLEVQFQPQEVRRALYRPFTREYLYFDSVMTHRQGMFPHIFPTIASEQENTVIILSDAGYRSAFSTLISDTIPDLHLIASLDAFQCFPYYTYDEDGRNRQENITEWALGQFRAAYGDGVTKRDIWRYVYALLHHPQYRERYAENLKRELPRIPLAPAPDFAGFVAAGARLAELHLGYESVTPHPLTATATKTPPNWRVTKMALSREKDAIIYNDSIRLDGVPAAAFAYRLGNRSALEWVIDQYQVHTDARSGITSDPNRADDSHYIEQLLGRVITVSVETQRIVGGLPALPEVATVAAVGGVAGE
ncbi:MAG: N-6 DNA methylase [Ktedonobacterales bacterium]|nr:N-6 DNA methylase [Ktedonobacterales bacterium]